MKVGLIDVDGHNFPNLPLMKLSSWHKSQGDSVKWYDAMFDSVGEPLDIVYMSKVFSFTPDYPFFVNAKKISKGGSGYCITLVDGKEVFDKSKDIELPYEIEHAYPDYSIYYDTIPAVKDTAYGFLTRGCPRGCSFCIVKSKEGQCSRKVADLSEFWNGQKNINLCDPNLFACPDWKELAEQLVASNATIEFNQGVDIRVMTKEKIEYIKRMKVKAIHFAWDRYEDKEIITKKLTEWTEIMGEKYNRSKVICYTLTGFNTTMEQNLERIYWLKSKKISPYVMIYNKDSLPKGHELLKLARYVNNRFVFWSCDSFEEYMKKQGGQKENENAFYNNSCV